MTSMNEPETIVQIARRASEMAWKAGIEYNVLDAVMDITAVNDTTPLRLQELLEADNFEFAHDIFGIRQNINRSNGQLENSFLPRYAKHEEAA